MQYIPQKDVNINSDSFKLVFLSVVHVTVPVLKAPYMYTITIIRVSTY